VVIGNPALNAYNDSIRRTVLEIVDDLRLALGAKLVAYIAGVSETRTVREWAEDARRPTPAAEERLRLAHRIVTLIGQSEGEAIVPTWFQGMNPQLGNRSPARVLHEDSFDEAGTRVLAVANAFVGAAVTSDQRPGLRAYEDSVRLPFPELVDELREIIGARLVAYIGGVMSTMSVSAWARGTEAPDEADRERLRHAFHVAALLRERYDAITVQSWFNGRNPSLDTAPAHVLREGDPLEGARDVIAAAKSFAYLG
jgi:hypothetical protein